MEKKNTCTFKKDMELELLIEDMSSDGEGIGKSEGAAFFVKDAILGDRVRVKIMKMKKNYGYARLMEILEPSPYRVIPKCAYHRQCGGCQIQVMDYHQQLKFKENKVKNNLKRIGGFQIDEKVHPIIGMDEPYFYRNKAQFPIGTDKNGHIVTGFYAARTHDIIPNRKCFLGVDINEKVLEHVISFMEENSITAYDEISGKGLVRHVLVRFGFTTKEIMVCIVINGKTLPNKEKLVGKLRQLEGMTSITLNVNEKKTNVILGEEIINLWGQNYITDYIGDVKYQISPLSFYQVNPVQTRKLYECALQYAGLTGTEIVWDLYCGIGTISLFLAQKAKYVYGVEVVEAAIKDARNNAKINGIDNVEFFVGKAEEVLPDFYAQGRIRKLAADAAYAPRGEQGKRCPCPIETRKKKRRMQQEARREAVGEDIREIAGEDVSEVVDGRVEDGMLHPDVIVVDPPRKGCDIKCLETIVKMQPKRVVYVSCDSATLARDLKYLCGQGFEVEQVQVVDMFPNTTHVESICLLHRKDS